MLLRQVAKPFICKSLRLIFARFLRFFIFFCFGESGGDRSLYTSKKGNTSADIIRPEKQISAPWPLFKKELSSVLRLEILRTVPVLSYPA